MLAVTKDAPASQNRYIYYPGGVTRLPGNLLEFMKLRNHPMTEGFFKGLLGESFRKRPKDLTDESIGSFISRRFHPKLAQNIASAIMHGIYAGDVDQLSMRSTMPRLWQYEKHYGSVTKGILKLIMGNTLETRSEELLRASLLPPNKWIVSRMKKTSVVTYSFYSGIEYLTKKIAQYLEGKHNIRIGKNQTVKSVKLGRDASRPVEVCIFPTFAPFFSFSMLRGSQC